MKILNVAASLDPVSGGGVAERTLQISREMSRLGADVRILTTDVGLTREYRESIKEVEIIALPCAFTRFYLPLFSYGLVYKMVADADIIHLMGHWTFINALVYFAARASRKPYTVCPAGALPVYGRSGILKRIYNLVIGRRIVAGSETAIAVSTNELAHFKAYDVAEDRIRVIPNGVNADEFAPAGSGDFREKYSLGTAPFLLFMGRLNVIKGPDLLLEAFSDVQRDFLEYHLVFAGPDGGMLAELKKRADEARLGARVHFLGHLASADKTGAYRAADLLVIPSRQEAMSIVVLEAGICGVPVLLTDQCGFDDVAAVDGGMVVPASREGLRGGLKALLKDREKLRRMGSALERYVLAGFTWKNAAEKYLRLSRQIAGIE